MNTKPTQDSPAEGSRETIERALQRDQKREKSKKSQADGTDPKVRPNESQHSQN